MKEFFVFDWQFLQIGCILWLVTMHCALYADDLHSDFEAKTVEVAVDSPISEMQKELAGYKALVSELKAENETLKTENIQKRTEDAQKTKRISTLETELQQAKDARNKVENELKKAQKDAETLRKNLADLQKKLEERESQVSKMNTEIVKKSDELARKTQEIAQKVQEINGKNDEIARKSEKISGLEAKVNALETQKRNLEQNGKVLEKKLSDAGEQVKMLQKQIEDLKTVQRKLKSRISKEKTELAAEKSLLEEQNRVLRSELIDTLERCAAISERLKCLELSAAGTLETLNPMYAGQREAELSDTVSLLTQTGMRLVRLSTNVCDIVLPKLHELKLSTVEEARWRVALDELRTQTQSFARLGTPAVPVENFSSCRIVETHSDPELIILNAGFRNGVRVNAVLHAGSGEDKVTMRVIAVRPFISAAVPENGDWKKLVPGVEVRVAEASLKSESKQ